MKTLTTVEQAIRVLREPITYVESNEDLVQVADWLEDYMKLQHKLKVYEKAFADVCSKGYCPNCPVDEEENHFECHNDCDRYRMDYYLHQSEQSLKDNE